MEELVAETIARMRLWISTGMRSVLKSVSDLVWIIKDDDKHGEGLLRRQREYEYSASCVYIDVGQRYSCKLMHTAYNR